MKEAFKALAGQMSYGLLRILAAQQQEADMGIGERVFDHALDAEIFRVHGADDGETFRLMLPKAFDERFTVQRTYGYRCP